MDGGKYFWILFECFKSFSVSVSYSWTMSCTLAVSSRSTTITTVDISRNTVRMCQQPPSRARVSCSWRAIRPCICCLFMTWLCTTDSTAPYLRWLLLPSVSRTGTVVVTWIYVLIRMQVHKKLDWMLLFLLFLVNDYCILILIKMFVPTSLCLWSIIDNESFMPVVPYLT